MSKSELIQRYDYKLVPWNQFRGEEVLPEVRVRAMAMNPDDDDSAWVVFDPCDDADGLLLIGTNKRQILNVAHKHIKRLYDV